MIVEWQDKTWERLGECNHCGECCAAGYRNPCPALRILPSSASFCAIYDQRSERDDPDIYDACGVVTTHCASFPASPGDLSYPAIRNRCGYYFVERPKVLVVSVTHECKEYAWDTWSERVQSLTYPAYDVLVVDNSPGSDFYHRHHQKPYPVVPVGGDPRPEMWLRRICQSMAAAQSIFLQGAYSHWMNIESDVIPPPNVIETLMKRGQDADWVSHCYPQRAGSETLEQGIGCSLLSRRLMTDFDWRRAEDSPDAELWKFCRRNPYTYRTVELWDIMPVEHLRYENQA